MSDGSASLLSCLSLVFWLVVIALGLSWVSKRIFPRNQLLRRVVRTVLRLIFISPFRAVVSVVRWFVRALRDTRPDYRRHQLFFDRYPVSPLELYAVIEDTFARRQVIGVEVRRITRLEWHLFSSRRTYLFIRYREAVCSIGAVPVGTGLLVSWRYSALPSRGNLMLFEVPYLGPLFERLIAPPTFYRTDVYEGLEQAIRGCVADATNALTQRGVRPLTANEQRPLLREFYNR